MSALKWHFLLKHKSTHVISMPTNLCGSLVYITLHFLSRLTLKVVHNPFLTLCPCGLLDSGSSFLPLVPILRVLPSSTPLPMVLLYTLECSFPVWHLEVRILEFKNTAILLNFFFVLIPGMGHGGCFRLSIAVDYDLPCALAGVWFCQLR